MEKPLLQPQDLRNHPRAMSWSPHIDLDATGRPSDEWSLLDGQSEAPSIIDIDEVHSIASTEDYDVRSVASSSVASSSVAHSVRSVGSHRSWTAVYGDHLRDGDTAPTAGAQPVPLSALPHGFIHRVHSRGESAEDTASLVSVNTRRGWPRVSPGSVPASLPGTQPPGSYLAAVLREPPPSRTEAPHNATQRAPRRPPSSSDPRHASAKPAGSGRQAPRADVVAGRELLAPQSVSLSGRFGRRSRRSHVDRHHHQQGDALEPLFEEEE
jgi:hypothetical protein